MSGIAVSQSPSSQRKTFALPPLREELALFPGAPGIDGIPTWVLQDPVAHRFFRIGWKEYEILSRWTLNSVDEIKRDIAEQTTLSITTNDIDRLLKFLATHNLIQSRGAMAISRLREQADKLKRKDVVWLVKNYLFIRIPLVRPDRFLEKTLPYLRWLTSKTFVFVTIGALLAGIWLAQRNWDGFLSQFPYFFSLQGLITMFLVLTAAKILHELGHAYACKRFGCRVPSIGVAFLVMWPVLYTDASDAWRLTSRYQRMAIGGAGIVVELVLAIYATLLWSFLPDGALRSSVFLLATATWLVTLFINLNPFMRFDGYYLLSDLLGIPNLQDRAFAIARWRLREALFGLNAPIPENFPTKTYRLLLVYSYGTWIYRFFLFLGIALLVYFFFFKILGIALMIVELAWFIGRPILNEFKAWNENKALMTINRQTIRTGLLVTAILALLLFPWQRDVKAPALLRAEQHTNLYAPVASQVVSIKVSPGDSVKAGDVLFELSSPALDHEIRVGNIRLEMLRWLTDNQGFNNELLERAPVAWQELQAENTSQQGRYQEQHSLIIKSPIDGVVREIQQSITEGAWLPEDEWLALVVSPESVVIEAWVNERDLDRINPNTSARFYTDNAVRPPFDVVIATVDTASTRALTEPSLASVHGGPIAVRVDSEDNYIPEQPVYRVSAPVNIENLSPEQVLRGSLHIEADRQSLAAQIWRNVASILIRESGF
ncbi:HlyD family efflux transporter periplasmic adaptor subunit [Pseudohongiella sp. O18]|uniref:HlyD family efflux transporter periplasmic adaptor subunit n=1 Tax=Pseudohongiella sp. O18 TaxID=2904248 RepID=UPI001F208C61|nr:HlyD family efflux transporter periplasmic adaptor subunit [Pseudohongiella sp. O18]